MPSRGGTFVQPSETLCTHIHGLQVAVAVGLEGDPLGRNILGLPASVPVIVVVAEVVGIVKVMAVVPSVATVGTSSGRSYVTTLFCPFTGAKKSLVDDKSSSWLASVVLRILLGGSTCLVLCLLESSWYCLYRGIGGLLCQ